MKTGITYFVLAFFSIAIQAGEYCDFVEGVWTGEVHNEAENYHYRYEISYLSDASFIFESVVYATDGDDENNVYNTGATRETGVWSCEDNLLSSTTKNINDERVHRSATVYNILEADGSYMVTKTKSGFFPGIRYEMYKSH